jgi:uncharacterized protein with ParB-like and HNH nuclease domain
VNKTEMDHIAEEKLVQSNNWFDDYVEDEEALQIDEYDLTATPNDFNVITIFSFIESGALRIPGFQRNFVWDLSRSSKLIESLILGLPVPQLFLYEEARNKFLVIDGQQRLMSIYYFIKQRFPRKEKRVELRSIFDKHGKIPDDTLHNDDYFVNFKLSLPDKLPGHSNKFNGLKYSTLEDYKTQFELRPIRNVVVKQNVPEDDSSVYEIFNRLNSGGINLRPQEIRNSLYHSEFYQMLYRINLEPKWREILKSTEPDLHQKDVEILMRGFAMLIDSSNYASSMVRFLNQFSKKCKNNLPDQNTYLEQVFQGFLSSCQDLPEDAFVNPKTNRFNIALYEAVFTAACEPAFKEKSIEILPLKPDAIKALENDDVFVAASQKATTTKTNVTSRIERARAIIA